MVCKHFFLLTICTIRTEKKVNHLKIKSEQMIMTKILELHVMYLSFCKQRISKNCKLKLQLKPLSASYTFTMVELK